jgi:hypothetical protein
LDVEGICGIGLRSVDEDERGQELIDSEGHGEGVSDGINSAFDQILVVALSSVYFLEPRLMMMIRQ